MGKNGFNEQLENILKGKMNVNDLKEKFNDYKNGIEKQLKNAFNENNSFKEHKNDNTSKNEHKSNAKNISKDKISIKDLKRSIKSNKMILIAFGVLLLLAGFLVLKPKENKVEHIDLVINEEKNAEFILEKGAEYTFMYDEWTTYVATAISNSSLKLELWKKTMSNQKGPKKDEEIGVYKINDATNGFMWADAEQKLAFRFNFQGKMDGNQKKINLRYFTINVNDGDDNKGTDYNEQIKSFKYDRDKNYFYRAILLNNDIMKIECWSKGFLLTPDLFYYDCRLVDVSKNSNVFEWSDEERTSFLITMKDEENGNLNWKGNENVFYEIENIGYKYNSILDYKTKKQVQNTATNVSSNENINKTDNSVSQEEKALSENFPKSVAVAAIEYTISNYNNLDAFNADGSTFNMSKMKPYGEKTKYSYSVYDSGKWSVKDSNTWHVDNLVLKPDNVSSGNAYQAIITDVIKIDNGYKLSNLKYLILSGKKVTERDVEFYGWMDLTEEICPMMNVDVSMLQKAIVSEGAKVEATTVQETTVQETKKKRNIFDDPDVKMNRFIDSMCRQQYKYGYKISSLSVNEISDGVLDGKCNLRIKNSSGVWGNYTLHCVVDFNNEKVITWDVY